MKCKHCNKDFSKYGVKNHEKRCKENPNRIEHLSKKWLESMRNKKPSNQYIHAKENSYEYKIKEETRLKMSESSKGRKHTQESKDKISKARKDFLSKNPDKVPYLLNHKSKGPSYPERYFSKIFQNTKVVSQYKLGTYSLDFAESSLKIDIEIDGEQHYLDERIIEHDKKRNNYINSLGWKIIRIRWSKYRSLTKNKRKEFIKCLYDEIGIIPDF